MKSICISSAYYPPHLGGVELFTKNLAATLAARGIAVTVVTDGFNGAEPYEMEDNGVEVFRLSASDPSGRFPVLLRTKWSQAIWRELESRTFDAIVVNTRFYPLSLKMLDFAHGKGLRPILIEHGSSYLTLGNQVADQAIHAYEDGIARLVQRSNPLCYGVSQEAAEWVSHFGLDACGVIHNSIDAAAFRASASKRAFRDEFNMSTDTVMVSFTGRLIQEKGVWMCVEAARMMRGSNVEFMIAGDGPELQNLQREAPDNCHILGKLEHADVAALLSQSDVFCFPSSYPEGLPTSLLEAAASGCYIITAPVAGAREIVLDDDHGCVLHEVNTREVCAAIRECIDDPERVSRATAKCLSHVEREFSWDKAADDVLLAGMRSR